MLPDKLLASRVHFVEIKLSRVMVAVVALKCGRHDIIPDMVAVCLSDCMIAGVEPFRNLLQLFDDNIARKITDQMVPHRYQIHSGCRLEIGDLPPCVGAGIRPARADDFDLCLPSLPTGYSLFCLEWFCPNPRAFASLGICRHHIRSSFLYFSFYLP